MKKRLRIDLLAPPFSGHLNPVLAMARVLNDDYDLRVVSTPSVQDRIRQAGIVAVPLLEGLDATLQAIASPPYSVGSNPFRLHRQFFEVLGILHRLRTELLKMYREERPDLLIADFTLATAGVVADELNIPWWTSLPSPCVLETTGAPPAYLGGWKPMHGFFGNLRDGAGRICVRRFKRSIAWIYRSSIERAGLRSIYQEDGSEAIYSKECILVLGMPQLEFAEIWPRAATLIGPMLYTPAISVEAPQFVEGRQHVLVTMGTHLHWIKDRVAATLRRVAVRMPDIEFHFSDGCAGGRAESFDRNFSRFPFVDYARHIHRYDVVVHHGGAGVMYYCLKEGRRSIVYPVDYDQFDNAARLEYAGVACRMQSLWQMEGLLRKTLSDNEMAKRCADYSLRIHAFSPEQALKQRVADFFDEKRVKTSAS